MVRRKKIGINSAPHQFYLPPLRCRDPAIELRPRETGDRTHESGVSYLFGQTEVFRSVEFVRTVNGEAVWNAGQKVRQHRYLGAVGSEVGVDMTYSLLAKPCGQNEGLRKI